MRRRPNRLKVSTFPFLAVLLCAMGALILVLVVLDRRAKIVARSKIVERREEVTRDRELEIAKRWQEWDRQRQELQARLQQQHQDLVIAKTSTDQQAQKTAAEIAREKSQQRDLEEKIARETAALGQAQQALVNEKAKLASTAAQAPKASNEIVQLGFEVKELEETLSNLKEQQRQGQNTYSLVPYKGSKGAERVPIYVEVSADGLIFHPDRKTIASVWLESDLVRTEIADRAARLDPNAKDAAKANRPYVFFIVRPNGVENYYKAQAALRRVELDFGYEFVEADWQLDFGAKDAAAQLAKLTAKSNAGLGTADPARQRAGATAGVNLNGGHGAGSPPAASVGFGGPVNGNDPLADLPPIGVPSGGPQTAMLPAFDPGSDLPPQGKGAEIGPISPDRDLPPDSGSPPMTYATLGQPLRAPSFIPANPSGGVPNDDLPPVAVSDTGPPSFPAPVEQKQTVNAQPASVPVPLANQMLQRLASEKGTQSANQPSQTLPPGQVSEAETDASPERSELPPSAPAIQPPAERPRKTPPPISRLIGNRDFIVTIECTEAGAVVWPRGKNFDSAVLQKPGRDNAVALEVRDLIAQRQATVAAGETPYRPEIRFRIHPEGRRTFFLAYPLLEELGVPMTREDANK